MFFTSKSHFEAIVSRETIAKINLFVDLLEKWNKKINLIRYNNHDELWERHILDCANLTHFIPKDTKVLTDFGSGGGFPGIIISIMMDIEVHLIESDERKSIFLKEASKFAKNKVYVHTQRIESIDAWESDVLTARAVAPMVKLIPLTKRFIDKSKICLYQKGKNSVEEIKEAKKEIKDNYNITIIDIPNGGTIVKIMR